MKMIHGLVFSVVLVGFCTFAFAERVVLKSGESFDGVILERNDQYITIQTGGAPVYLTMEDIDQIIEDNQINQRQNVLSRPQPKEISTTSQSLKLQEVKTDAKADEINKEASYKGNDLQNLKEQKQLAYNALEAFDENKKEIKAVSSQIDSDVLNILKRVAMIVGVFIGIFIIIRAYKMVTTTSDISHFVKSKSPAFLESAGTLSFAKASPNKRISALLIDLLIVIVPLLVIFALGGVLFGVLAFLVYMLLKDLFSGQSLGKKIVGIRIIDKDHQPALPIMVFLRNSYWILVCLLPFIHPYLAVGSLFLIVGELFNMWLDPLGQRLGDRLSAVRVEDLRPKSSEWIYVLVSLMVIVCFFLMVQVLKVSSVWLLNQSDITISMQEYKDPQGRFSFRVPSGFLNDPNYSQGNALVFHHQQGKRLLSVLVVNRDEVQIFSQDQLDVMAASFLALKLKVDVKDMLAKALPTKLDVNGLSATMFLYESKEGKNVSVCFLKDKQFYEINFVFKGDQDIDQMLVNDFLKNFKV